MTTYEPTQVESTDLPSDTLLIGEDADGDLHRYSRFANTVYVGDAGADQLAAYDLDAHPKNGFDVTAWVAFVRQDRGWAECRYVRDWGQHMAETVKEAGV